MICEYLDVYKNGVLLTDTTGLRNGDILTVVVRTDRRPGYVFVGWVGLNGERLNPYPNEVVGTEYPTFIFNLTCDTYINALFRQGVTPMVTISTVPNNPEWGSTSGSGTFEVGTEVTITATVEDACYSRFVEWRKKVGGEFVSIENPCTVIATEDKMYEAVFELVDYVISLTSNNERYGTVSQDGSVYRLGDVATFTAIPSENCTFDGWYIGEDLLSMDLVYQYTIGKTGGECNPTRNIQGKFHNNLYEVNVFMDEVEIPANNVTVN